MASLLPYLDAPSFPKHLQRELTNYDRDLIGAFNRMTKKWEIWIRDKLGREGKRAFHRVHQWPGEQPCHGMIKALRASDTWIDGAPDQWALDYVARQDAEEAARQHDFGNYCESIVSDNVRALRRDMEKIRPHGISESDIRERGAE
mgnify:CR=1 FL=1